MTTDVTGEVEVEHLHRYFLARHLCRGSDVLDIASGEGYGAALIAQTAKSVVGVEIDSGVVEHARRAYDAPNLRYEQGEARAIPLPDSSVDWVTSFETVEHFYEQEEFLKEIRRVLRPGGKVLMSSPDRDVFSPPGSTANPYHVRELTRLEFTNLLKSNFQNVVLLGQRPIVGSVIVPGLSDDGVGECLTFGRRDGEFFEASRGLDRVMYWVAVASDGPLPPSGSSFYFEKAGVNDALVTVPALQHELGRAIADNAAVAKREERLNAVIAEKNAQLAELTYHLNRINASPWWRFGLEVTRISRIPGRMIREWTSSRAPQSGGAPEQMSSTPRFKRPEAAGFDAVLRKLEDLLPASLQTRGARRREILVVANHLPLFDQASGCLRLKTLIDILGLAGWSVAFGSIRGLGDQPGVLANPDGRARYERALQGSGVRRFLYGSDEIDAFLKTNGRSLDWCFLSFPNVAEHFIPMVRSRCPTTRIAYDMVDFHALRMEREALLRDDAELLAKAKQQRAIEIACALAADVTFAVSTKEKAALLELAPTAVVEILPNIFELPPEPIPGPQTRKDLLFIGGFWHRPNGDAVRWFAERIFPLIRAEAPDVVFRIAGAHPDEEVRALGTHAGIEVLGYVRDLSPLLNSHRALVAPVRYGAGMLGKVGQSMAHGLPVVTTPIGAEGMDAKDESELLVASDEKAFAAQVLRLLRDDALWSRLSHEGRALVERALSVDVVRAQLETVISG